MSDQGSRTGLVVVAVITAVFVAAIATWLFWWRPKQAREAAEAQVAAWEARWLDARACILGDEPLSGDAADALALAELATGSLRSNATDCTRAVGAITRPPGDEATDEVERAFAEVEAAIPAVAKAYAFRISADGDEVDRRAGALGVAINALDAAHDRLRAAAGLAPLDRRGGAPLVRTPEPAPLVAGGGPVAVAEASVRAGVITIERWGEAHVVHRLTAPGKVTTTRSAPEAHVAVPDGTWMVASLPGRAFDERASVDAIVPVALPTADRVEHVVAVPVAPPTPPHVALGALGAGADRAVLLVEQATPTSTPRADAPAFAVVHSRDGGKTWAPARAAIAPGVIEQVEDDPLGGGVDVVAVGDVVRWYRFDAARPLELPAPLAAPRLPADEACRKGAIVWGYDGAAAVRLARDAVTRTPLPPPGFDTRVHDCTADAVLLEESSMPVRYHRCDGRGCQEVFRGSTYAYGRAAMLDDGTVVYAAGRAHLIALWREGVADPVYFKLPRALTLHALVVWDGVPHALLHDAGAGDPDLLVVPLAG